MDKLLDLRHAAREEGFEIGVPDELNRIDKVGQFQLVSKGGGELGRAASGAS